MTNTDSKSTAVHLSSDLHDLCALQKTIPDIECGEPKFTTRKDKTKQTQILHERVSCNAKNLRQASTHKFRTQYFFDNVVHVSRTVSVEIGRNQLPRSFLVWAEGQNSFKSVSKSASLNFVQMCFKTFGKYLTAFLHMPFAFIHVFDCQFPATQGINLGIVGNLYRTHDGFYV